jgi:hypothetical protein
MSGRIARPYGIRQVAVALILALTVLAPASTDAQSPPPETGQSEPQKPGGVKSFLNKLWSGLSGKDKSADEPEPERSADPAAPDPAQPGPAAEPGAAPATAPSLAQARWIGFTPVLAVGASDGAGAWLAGPFPEAGSNGWVTDTVSGLTVRVRLVWREAEPGRLARLSAEAAESLGLAPGAVTNVAIYLDP